MVSPRSIKHLFTFALADNTSDYWVVHFWIHPSLRTTEPLTALKKEIPKLLPQILMAECDNPAGLPFCQEIYTTETAHLFEHILLEYLCKIKLEQGETEASYDGRTFWDAHETKGEQFTICISKEGESFTQFTSALRLSSALLTTVIKNSDIVEPLGHVERGASPLSTQILS